MYLKTKDYFWEIVERLQTMGYKIGSIERELKYISITSDKVFNSVEKKPNSDEVWFYKNKLVNEKPKPLDVFPETQFTYDNRILSSDKLNIHLKDLNKKSVVRNSRFTNFYYFEDILIENKTFQRSLRLIKTEDFTLKLEYIILTERDDSGGIYTKEVYDFIENSQFIKSKTQPSTFNFFYKKEIIFQLELDFGGSLSQFEFELPNKFDIRFESANVHSDMVIPFKNKHKGKGLVEPINLVGLNSEGVLSYFLTKEMANKCFDFNRDGYRHDNLIISIPSYIGSSAHKQAIKYEKSWSESNVVNRFLSRF